MMKTIFITLFTLCFCIKFSEMKLVFTPGSDVGYIVLDADVVKELLPEERLVYEENGALRMPRRQIREEQPIENYIQYDRLWLPHAVEDHSPSAEKVTDKKGFYGNDIPDYLKDPNHGVKMGISDRSCDDGKTNLLIDWDYSPANYTCYNQRKLLPPNNQEPVRSILHCDVPSDYIPQHICMDQAIEYSSRIPTHEDHRPLWAQFGEYKFLPPQRWLHNIEHGSVVMLYHPCAQPNLVSELRRIVTDCLYKHIITPYSRLTPERPLALVAWGCSLEMGSVDAKEVQQFIKEKALLGPEGKLRKQGMFKEGLILPSVVPDGSSDKDLPLCTNLDHNLTEQGRY